MGIGGYEEEWIAAAGLRSCELSYHGAGVIAFTVLIRAICSIHRSDSHDSLSQTDAKTDALVTPNRWLEPGRPMPRELPGRPRWVLS